MTTGTKAGVVYQQGPLTNTGLGLPDNSGGYCLGFPRRCEEAGSAPAAVRSHHRVIYLKTACRLTVPLAR